MKKIIVTALSAVGLLASGVVVADSHSELPDFAPIETYTCNYNEGMGPEDLDEAAAGWNKWMDDEGQGNYWAATVVPVYFGPDAFDFGWIGSWTSGTEMGTGTDKWLTEGGEYAAKFAAVADCNTHSGFAGSMIKAPPDTSPDTIVLAFSDCNITTDDPNADLFAKFAQWTEFAEERGYKNGAWVLFPVYGAGGAKFDFKMVQGYDSFADQGADWDLYASGDYVKAGEINAGDWECDDARIYRATVRRRIAEED